MIFIVRSFLAAAVSRGIKLILSHHGKIKSPDANVRASILWPDYLAGTALVAGVAVAGAVAALAAA